MTRFKDFITEAFKVEQAGKMVGIIKKVLEKRLGKKLFDYGERVFDAKGGQMHGILLGIDGSPKAIQFNFKGGGKLTQIHSVDIWDATDSPDPAVNIETKGLSIIKILPAIVSFIEKPVVKKDILVAPIQEMRVMDKDTILSEGLVEYDGKDFASKSDAAIHALEQGKDSRFIRRNFGFSMANLQKKLEKLQKKGKATKTKASALEKLKVNRGKKLKIVPGSDVKKSSKQLANIQYADPKTIFKDLESLVNMIISGIQPSLLITGMAGIGKTFTVQKQLKAAGKVKGQDFVVKKGAVSPFGLYRTLFINRKRIVVFDDSDDVFKDATAKNILKAALDSHDVRDISWESKNTYPINPLDPLSDDEMDSLALGEKPMFPSNFIFDGQVIFISNLNINQIDAAVKSRSFAIDVTLKATDVFARMESVLDKMIPDVVIFGQKKTVPMSVKKEVLEILKKDGVDLNKEANMRTFLNAVKIRMSGDPNWRQMMIRFA